MSSNGGVQSKFSLSFNIGVPSPSSVLSSAIADFMGVVSIAVVAVFAGAVEALELSVSPLMIKSCSFNLSVSDSMPQMYPAMKALKFEVLFSFMYFLNSDSF